MLRAELLRAVHARAREHGVDADALHDTISLGFGKRSVKDLTEAEAKQLLDGLRGSKPATRRKYKAPARVRREMGLAGSRGRESDMEVLVDGRMMGTLTNAFGRLGWDEARATGFIRRQLGKDAPVTLAELNKVLWAVKAMERRRD